MKSSVGVIFEVPTGVVTVMSTVPVPVPVSLVPESGVIAAVVNAVLGGLVTVICVPESVMIVPATWPKRTMLARRGRSR